MERSLLSFPKMFVTSVSRNFVTVQSWMTIALMQWAAFLVSVQQEKHQIGKWVDASREDTIDPKEKIRPIVGDHQGNAEHKPFAAKEHERKPRYSLTKARLVERKGKHKNHWETIKDQLISILGEFETLHNRHTGQIRIAMHLIELVWAKVLSKDSLPFKHAPNGRELNKANVDKEFSLNVNIRVHNKWEAPMVFLQYRKTYCHRSVLVIKNSTLLQYAVLIQFI